ncbi:acyl-CoA dehydrogenase family protein [Thermomonospora cellulosilytica]|uniref:Alkylation response protein AidB-like acyl-CoA dehydrogenase n=1 Tax=Thermomonospora cellulosilytica TaxID=1411118 RepID=A0A7W3MYD5_9ACTN|nr:acyl-CoA dehydrogenase family protein [Thermomonospora cellulosilytica]MBA9004167.1 alkylation response protein AidB-like acyl-CoA dehydrogenase [Thermomonospora cellulosilytica]
MSDELDLLYTDVEESVRDSVRSLLAKRSTPEQVVRVYDGDRSGLAELWQALAAELGLAALLVPEEHGGAGASAREAAVVLEELGRYVAPVPFLTSAVVATTALLEAGATDRLGELAAGERTAALAVPFSTAPGRAVPAVSVNGGVLQGSVHAVAGALEADLLLVPVRTDGGLELHEVSGGDARVTPVTSLDMTRQVADIDLTGVASRRIAGADAAERAVGRALETGAALMASEQYGVAQWCLDTTVEYLKIRRQFGRIVGGFQALKHRLADLYVTVESARAAARYAAAAVAADDPDRSVAASVAQAYCADAAVLAAEEAIQLHGGVGMTWEHPAHLYLKRAKADQIALGTPGAHHALLAGLVDLPAA